MKFVSEVPSVVQRERVVWMMSFKSHWYIYNRELCVFVCLIILSCKGLTKKVWCIITQSLAMEQEQKVSELN